MKKITKIGCIFAAVVAFFIGCTFLPVPKKHLIYEDNENGVTVSKYTGHRLYVNLPDTIDGKPVTKIGKRALYRDRDSRSSNEWGMFLGVKIPDTVTEIGEEAFYDCDLRSVRLPKDLIKLGEGAFYNNSFKSVSIPENVTEIPKNCFLDCSSLKSVKLNNIAKIGDGAFAYCYSLKDCELKEGVEYIGDTAFERCIALGIREIPTTVEYIGNYAFMETPFESTLGKDEMTVINGKILYRYNVNDPNPVIPDGVISICGGAFENTSIKSIELPENIKYIGGRAFAGCDGLESIVVPDGAELCGKNTFADCKNLVSVKLGCDELPAGIFNGCESLKNIEFTREPQIIGTGAFGGCTSLENFSDEKAKEVRSSAFAQCSALKEVYLPNVTEFGGEAFLKSGIEKTELAEGIQTIPSRMFEDCKSLKSVSLPKSTVSIDEYAFSGCEALEEVRAKNGLQIIKSRAFAGSGLKSFDMPDTVSFLQDCVFMNCKNLRHIKFSDGLSAIDIDCCSGCEQLSDVILPKNIEYIALNAFWKDKSLEYIYLPDGLKGIGLNAFADTGIWTVYIPDSVEKFDRQAFCCDHGVQILHTADCAAAEQIEQARQWGLVHDTYFVDIVSSREEAENKYIFPNNQNGQ